MPIWAPFSKGHGAPHRVREVPRAVGSGGATWACSNNGGYEMKKYGVYSVTTAGLNLFSSHYKKSVADRNAAKRSAAGFPCVVRPVGK